VSRARRIACAVAAASAIGVALWRGSADDERTTRVAREDFAVLVEAPGKLQAAVSFEIGPPSVPDVWEYELAWMSPEGTTVKTGDVVARFDATQIEDNLRDHRAALEKVVQEKEKERRNLEVSLGQLALDLVKAEGELRTLGLDLDVPAELRSSIEVAELKMRRTLAEKRAAHLEQKIRFEQELVRSKLELLDVKRVHEETKVAYLAAARAKFDVQAPVDGLVIAMPKRDGNRWEVGESVWMMAKILQVADISTLEVQANVLEADAARIAPGQPAEITIDAVPGLTLHSKVSEVGRVIRERSPQDRSKVFDALLPIDGATSELIRPGMGVRVEIQAELLAGRLTVPLEAVLAAEDGTWVEVVGRRGVERRAVTLGPRNDRRVVVTSGLEEGDVVRLSEGRG
jgi:RND family efflux transporter MFP subunit